MHGAAGGAWRELLFDVGNMLKAFIGLNCMSVAYAFSRAGLARGVAGLVLITVLTEHCCMLLVHVKNALPECGGAPDGYALVAPDDDAAPPPAPGPPPTYGDIARLASGRLAEHVVNAALVLTQFGYCAGYLIFLSTTLHDMLPAPEQDAFPVHWLVLLPLPALAALAMLASIRSLGPFSTMANAALLLGFVSVVTFIARHYRWNPSHPPWTDFPIFFGQITAQLEGIGLVIPVETSMRNRARFPLVLRISLAVLSFVLMTIGVLGFTTYGADTQPIILINFGNSIVVKIVKSVLLVGILFTYPLQIIPVFQFFESLLLRDNAHPAPGEAIPVDAEAVQPDPPAPAADLDAVHKGDNDDDNDDSPAGALFVRDPRKIVLRVLIIALTAFVAVVAGKNYGLYQALVGALGASCLAYVAPAWLHLARFGDQLGSATKAKDIAIIAFGVIGSVVGTLTTVVAFINHESIGV